MNYLKNIASILALSASLGFTSGCKPAGEEGNGNGSGYDGGGMPPPEQCLSPEEFKETTIYSSTTICPGTYRGVTLKVMGDDIVLQGDSVTLDGLLAGGTAIRAENISRLHIKGFRFKDYGMGIDWYRNVKDSTIELNSYSNLSGGGTAIRSGEGLANRILGGNLEGDILLQGSSYEISNVSAGSVSGYIPDWYNASGVLNGVQITASTFSGVIEFSGTGHVIKDNQVEKICAEGMTNILLENNTVKTSVKNEEGCFGFGQRSTIAIACNDKCTIRGNVVESDPFPSWQGLTIYGNGAIIESNIVRNFDHPYNNYGVGVDGSNHDFIGNTVTDNFSGVHFAASNSVISGNTITDNQKYGLYLDGCNNDVQNNDLQNNGEGNVLINDEDCPNNTE